MNYKEVLIKLHNLSDPEAVKGMARFGIDPDNTYGVSIPNLRQIAKDIGKQHTLAQQLWNSGIHEARILAGMIDDPLLVTEAQMDKWAIDFNSWDVCDQCCMNLFEDTCFAYKKAIDWSSMEKEFVKRAGFTMMARLAVSDKKAPDEKFVQFLPVIEREAIDERNYVKKAVNWALRQIGKRNIDLNKLAIETANSMLQMDSKSARWIASDALRELTSNAVRSKLAV
ncbi:MAG: DNA alkylation repair protein [Chloroflexi bacterium]|nr:DNA alkylation repair protein [Chloroflexota bacterium]